MNTINIENLYPAYFDSDDVTGSDLWNTERTFEKGRTYLIKAASGHGKSSFCNFLFGTRSDYFGKICFDGTDVRTLGVSEWRNLRRKSLGLMFQDLELFPELTVYENIAIKNRITGYFSPERVSGMLALLGLKDKSERQAATLSLGERQRVAFIRALAQPLDFLLMDEPVSHLDADNAEKMSEILAQERSELDFGVIVTSLGNQLPMDYDELINL